MGISTTVITDFFFFSLANNWLFHIQTSFNSSVHKVPCKLCVPITLTIAQYIIFHTVHSKTRTFIGLSVPFHSDNCALPKHLIKSIHF